MSKEILISSVERAIFAIVDDADFEWLNQWKWYASTRPKGSFYAMRIDGAKTIYMHALLTGTQKGEHTDHINRDPLDNRRINLRRCTVSQNFANRGNRRDNKSGHRGVSWDSYNEKWVAQITYNKKGKKLGRYSTKEEAISVYREAATKIHGEFAHFAD